MDNETRSSGWYWVLLIAAALYIYSLRDDLKAAHVKIDELETSVSQEEQKVSEYKEKLEEANNAIEEAKGNEGGTYADMDDALSSLEPVEAPDE